MLNSDISDPLVHIRMNCCRRDFLKKSISGRKKKINYLKIELVCI